MLKSLALDSYFSNISISNTIMNFDQIYYLIKKKQIKWDKIKDKIKKTKISIR